MSTTQYDFVVDSVTRGRYSSSVELQNLPASTKPVNVGTTVADYGRFLTLSSLPKNVIDGLEPGQLLTLSFDFQNVLAEEEINARFLTGRPAGVGPNTVRPLGDGQPTLSVATEPSAARNQPAYSGPVYSGIDAPGQGSIGTGIPDPAGPASAPTAPVSPSTPLA